MLAPVRWDKNAWPVVNGDGTLAINMKCQTLPQVPMPLDPVREEFNFVKRDVPADSYSNIGLPWGWMSIGNPDYRLSMQPRRPLSWQDVRLSYVSTPPHSLRIPSGRRLSGRNHGLCSTPEPLWCDNRTKGRNAFGKVKYPCGSTQPWRPTRWTERRTGLLTHKFRQGLLLHASFRRWQFIHHTQQDGLPLPIHRGDRRVHRRDAWLVCPGWLVWIYNRVKKRASCR